MAGKLNHSRRSRSSSNSSQSNNESEDLKKLMEILLKLESYKLSGEALKEVEKLINMIKESIEQNPRMKDMFMAQLRAQVMAQKALMHAELLAETPQKGGTDPLHNPYLLNATPEEIEEYYNETVGEAGRLLEKRDPLEFARRRAFMALEAQRLAEIRTRKDMERWQKQAELGAAKGLPQGYYQELALQHHHKDIDAPLGIEGKGAHSGPDAAHSGPDAAQLLAGTAMLVALAYKYSGPIKILLNSMSSVFAGPSGKSRRHRGGKRTRKGKGKRRTSRTRTRKGKGKRRRTRRR